LCLLLFDFLISTSRVLLVVIIIVLLLLVQLRLVFNSCLLVLLVATRIIIELLRFKVHDIFGETPRPDGKISTAPLLVASSSSGCSTTGVGVGVLSRFTSMRASKQL
jgi:hypothetical protein